MNAKSANIDKTGEFKHTFYDALVFNKFKDILGGRVKRILTGSAPISKEVMKF